MDVLVVGLAVVPVGVLVIDELGALVEVLSVVEALVDG